MEGKEAGLQSVGAFCRSEIEVTNGRGSLSLRYTKHSPEAGLKSSNRPTRQWPKVCSYPYGENKSASEDLMEVK